MRKFFSVLGYFLFIGVAAFAYLRYDEARHAGPRVYRDADSPRAKPAIARQPPTFNEIVASVTPTGATNRRPHIPAQIIQKANDFLIAQNAQPADAPFDSSGGVELPARPKDYNDPFAPAVSETVPVPRDSNIVERRGDLSPSDPVEREAPRPQDVSATPNPQAEEAAIREKSAQINKMREVRGRLQQAQLGDMVHEVDVRIGALENEIKQLKAALELKLTALKTFQATSRNARIADRNRELGEQRGGAWQEVLREVRQLRGEVAEIRKEIGELRGSLKGAAASRPGMRIVTEEIMKDGQQIRIQRVVPTESIGPAPELQQRDAADPGGREVFRETFETSIINGKPVRLRRQRDATGERITLEAVPPDALAPTPDPDATAPTYQDPAPTSVEPVPPSTYESPDAFRKELESPAGTVELPAKPGAPRSTMQRLTGSEPQPGTYKLTIVRSSHGPAGQEPELTLTLEDPVHSLRKLTVDNLESWLGSIVQNAADKEVFKKSRMEIQVTGDTLGKQVLQLVQIVNKSGFGQVKVSYPPPDKKKPAEGDVSFATPETPSVETTHVIPLPRVVKSFDEPSAVDPTVDVFLGPATEPAAPISPAPATTSLAPAAPLAEEIQPVTSQPKVSVKVTSHVDEKTKKTSYQVFFVNSLTKTINGHDVVEQRSRLVAIDKASEVFTSLAEEYGKKHDLKTLPVEIVMDKNLPQFQFAKLIQMATKAGFGKVEAKAADAAPKVEPGAKAETSATY